MGKHRKPNRLAKRTGIAVAAAGVGVLGLTQAANAITLPAPVAHYEATHSIGFAHEWYQDASGHWWYRGPGGGYNGERGQVAVSGSIAPRRHATARKHTSRTYRRPAATGGGSCQATSTEMGIITPESGNNPNAVNPAGYYGLGQLSAANVARYGGGLGAGYCGQLKAMRGYIAGRYGSAGAALAFRQAHGWY